MRRRDFLKGMTAAPIVAAAASGLPAPQGELVNDVHTGLNPTWVSRIVRPTSVAEVQNLLKDCGKHERFLSVSGSRHAAGGQQFATDATLLDMRSMKRILDLDDKSGVLHVEAGIGCARRPRRAGAFT
jgi:FAD/FMN-containing dehydrogenase